MLNFNTLFSLISLLGIPKYFLLLIVFLMFFTTIIDLFSLGLIAPYVANILNINSSNYQFLNFLTIDYLSEDKLTLILTVILMALFLTKTILSISLRWLISVYSYKFFKILQVKLMHSYQFMDYQDYISRAPSEYIRNIRELCMDCLLFVDYSLRIISEAIILFAIIIFLAFFKLKNFSFSNFNNFTSSVVL